MCSSSQSSSLTERGAEYSVPISRCTPLHLMQISAPTLLEAQEGAGAPQSAQDWPPGRAWKLASRSTVDCRLSAAPLAGSGSGSGSAPLSANCTVTPCPAGATSAVASAIALWTNAALTLLSLCCSHSAGTPAAA